jgi:hypothetical protein
MALDLGDLIEDLLTEVNPPGSNLFPDATDDDWLSNLRNAFWETTLDGLISGYDEADGVVTQADGGTEDLSRDLQQIIIYYAGIRILKNRLSNLNTMFRSKAGPVEFETQNSATLLKSLLDEAVRRRDFWLAKISDLSNTTTVYIDAYNARNNSMYYGDIIWVDQ